MGHKLVGEIAAIICSHMLSYETILMPPYVVICRLEIHECVWDIFEFLVNPSIAQLSG